MANPYLQQIKDKLIDALNRINNRPVDELARDTATINALIDSLQAARNLIEQAIKADEESESGDGEDQPQPEDPQPVSPVVPPLPPDEGGHDDQCGNSGDYDQPY